MEAARNKTFLQAQIPRVVTIESSLIEQVEINLLNNKITDA